MTRHHIVFVVLAAATLACVPSGLKGNSVVVPNAFENTEGYIDNGAPFNLGKFGISSSRYQQSYAASQFPASPIRITAMSFRPDYFTGTAFNTTLANVQINLSTVKWPANTE